MLDSKGCSHIMRGLVVELEASGAEVDVAASRVAHAVAGSNHSFVHRSTKYHLAAAVGCCGVVNKALLLSSLLNVRGVACGIKSRPCAMTDDAQWVCSTKYERAT